MNIEKKLLLYHFITQLRESAGSSDLVMRVGQRVLTRGPGRSRADTYNLLQNL